MNPKILIIFEYQILFEILDEIHKSLNFKIIKCNKNEYKNIQFNPKIDYLVISKKRIDGVKNLLVLEDKILKLDKLVEIININL